MMSSTATPTPIDTPQNRVRHEWYQTDSQVVVSIFIKNAPKDTTSVQVTDSTLSVSVPLPTGSEYTLELDLAHKVDPAQSRHKVLGTKIEISLAKVDLGVKWTVLEGDDPLAAPVLASTTAAAKSYPSSSKSGPKDWDKVAKEVTKEEDKPEGDAALMKLFQDIYKNADENTRKAMIKSYTESNGTALSTSWDEVGKGKVETKPPEGMEAKPYMQ
ncbi:SGS domain-domain-containing protein [Catenaria anguillulae PL171]|uniref:SGS domain-domain-containing protein n=1 Tax=Catenaria anguillulae PL171 TaxID=765915 RepID=A0A1Y2HHX9_9FUNG|nr:SGS domain-domain-containing protein [Catenaria anguillulae PL171]